MSAAVGSSPSFVTPAHEGGSHSEETFTLFVPRFTLIDTAEEASQWISRAKRQWGGGKPLVVNVTSHSRRWGSTPPKGVTFSGAARRWAGIEWGLEAGIEVPLPKDPTLLLEVCLANPTNEVVGVGVIDAQSMIAEGRQYAKYCVHVFQLHAAQDADTVQALAEVEIHSSLLDEPPEDNFLPLEYNYGSVRVSTIDFYYPSFLLQGTGQYVVSNVICAMNMTESSSLAMQLVPLKEAADYILPKPSQVITVRPQQRVYFSGTYALTQPVCMRAMEMRLTVNGSQQTFAPIIIKVHANPPQPTATDVAYQYWVNTTCVSNRRMLTSQELPLIRATLPVFHFLGSGPIDLTEGLTVALDKDKGEQVLVGADGVPVAMGGFDGPALGGRPAGVGFGVEAGGGVALVGGFGADGQGAFRGMDLATDSFGDLLSHFSFDSNASFVVRDAGRSNLLPSRGPLMNLSQKTCLCAIVLGPIRGFPMVYESTTGISPSFQVSLTLLDQKGWQIVKGETLPSYQSASGSLRWTEQLLLRKWPGAASTQFVRLNLTEVRPRDGDETPIGAGLLSLSSMNRIYALNPMSVAFYVYETYSLYDRLNSPSLLMKDVSVVFSDVR